MNDLKQLLSAAHARFRQLRSGELGDNLRAQGIDYKLIWGLESYRLKEIAAQFAEVEADDRQALARALWQEDVRESKMLATRLYPAERMEQDEAQRWAAAISNTELADQAAMHLFGRLPYAETLATLWITDETPIVQYLGLKVASRMDVVPAAISQAAAQIKDNAQAPMWLRTAALWIE